MHRLSLLVIPVLLVAWPQENAQARSKGTGADPLAPLVKMGKVLQRAGSAALKGKSTAARGRIDLIVRPRAKRRMQKAGVRSIQLVGMEFELIFRHGSNVTYYLRSFVHPGKRRASLMSLSGRAPANGKLYVTGLGHNLFRGVAAPFGIAARRLRNSAPGRLCRNLTVTGPGLAKRLRLNARMTKRLLRDATRARRNRAKVCRVLAGTKNHSMSIRIDDVAFVARDGRGRLVGLVKGDIRLRRGRLMLSLRGFRAARP